MLAWAERYAGAAGFFAALAFAVLAATLRLDAGGAWALAFFGIVILGQALEWLARRVRDHWDVAPIEVQRALVAYGRENAEIDAAVAARKEAWPCWDWPDPDDFRYDDDPEPIEVASYDEFVRVFGSGIPGLAP